MNFESLYLRTHYHVAVNQFKTAISCYLLSRRKKNFAMNLLIVFCASKTKKKTEKNIRNDIHTKETTFIAWKLKLIKHNLLKVPPHRDF